MAGLTHKQSYKDIFAITLIKTAAVFVVIGGITPPASSEPRPSTHSPWKQPQS
ncbi:MAG: hypothetical protein IPI51_11000 [Betaproteobacteria bacterium]|nr:hypothetical protein [Betaproteobacteria bacterium]